MDLGRQLTLKEVAHQLGVSERTFRRLVGDRHFPPPAHTPGGRQVWFEADVIAYRHYLARGTWAPGEAAAVPEEED